MKNRYIKSLLTSAISITPVIVIIFIMSLSTLTPLTNDDYIMLGIGAVVLIVGLALFQIGASSSLSKVGEYMGASLSKQRRLWIVILFAFLLGTLITCAEPSILIVSTQININRFVLIGAIAAGVGIFVVIGIIRIFIQKSLQIWYLFFYFLTFVLICLLQIDPDNAAYLPFIFDAGGITTGSATVPFILALGAGFATVRGGKRASEDSFGLVGLASVGPILTMAILIILNKSGFSMYEVSPAPTGTVLDKFASALLPSDGAHLGTLIDVAMALAPIMIIFFVYELIFIKLPGRKVGELMIGFAISYIGLTLFLAGIGASMSPVGLKIGQGLGSKPAYVIFLIAFAIGLVTILCEPAVHVLTGQIEQISDGRISKKTVLLTLSIGVGLAILLSAIRAYYKFSIMYYILPGYFLSVLLMFVCPSIFSAIAFDSGGTASGPMTVSFVLPMIVGIVSRINGVTPEVWNTLTAEEQKCYTDINGFYYLTSSKQFYSDAFGVVAMVALTPILAIEILGVVLQIKKYMRLRIMRSQAHDESNNRIINF